LPNHHPNHSGIPNSRDEGKNKVIYTPSTGGGVQPLYRRVTPYSPRQGDHQNERGRPKRSKNTDEMATRTDKTDDDEKDDLDEDTQSPQQSLPTT
jgi:hypothetical protein